MAKIIRTIPAKLNAKNNLRLDSNIKKRVVGYARVSTDLDSQKTSYSSQLDYYKNYIESKGDWIFMGLYSDRGLSGTKTAIRDGFNNMINDGLNGKFDLIITKSISRFARNTLDSVSIIRKLKEKGVGVYFERENLDTLREDSELMLSIISGVAQEESHSISENIRWGIHKKFVNGEPFLPFKKMYGYNKDENGQLVIDQNQAKVVKKIFSLFLDGYSTYEIANILVKDKDKNIRGTTRWSATIVSNILSNEKYKGDSILQKTFKESFMSLGSIINTGQKPKYYVANTHEGIINNRVFDMVQMELKMRGEKRVIKRKNILSSKMFCGECGSPCGRKTYTINGEKVIAYLCNEKKNNKCKSHYIKESDAKMVARKAVNYLIKNRDNIIKQDTAKMNEYEDCSDLLHKKSELETALIEMKEEIDTLIKDIDYTRINDTKTNDASFDREVFRKQKIKYDELNTQLENRSRELEEVTYNINLIKCKSVKIELFIKALNTVSTEINRYDDNLCAKLIDRIEVHPSGVEVLFKDGRKSVNF